MDLLLSVITTSILCLYVLRIYAINVPFSLMERIHEGFLQSICTRGRLAERHSSHGRHLNGAMAGCRRDTLDHRAGLLRFERFNYRTKRHLGM